MQKWLYLLIGGGLGTLCRYLLSVWLPQSPLPYGTFTANLLGCVLLGLLIGFSEGRLDSTATLPQGLRLLVIVGFFGALTTFSTVELETLMLMKDGSAIRGVSYLLLSVFLGFAGLWFSYSWSRWFFGPARWN